MLSQEYQRRKKFEFLYGSIITELEKIHKYKLFRGRRERGSGASKGDHSLR